MGPSRRSRASFLATAATAALARPLRAQAQALTTINLGATPSDDMTPIVYGQKSGIFQKYGFDVQITRMTSGAAGIAGLLSETFTFAKGSITTVLSAHEKEVPLAIVAEAVVNDPSAVYAGFLVSKDSPIQSGKDFANQLVAVAAIGDIGSTALMDWVDSRGGNAKAIKFVEVPFTAAAAALDAGRVASAELSNPNLAVALASGKFRLLHVMDAIGSRYLEIGWIVTRDFSSKNPELVRAFSRAYGESVRYTSTHHAQTIPLMTAFTGIAPEIYANMPRALAWPMVVPAQIQPVIDVSAKYGLIQRSYAATEIIDTNVVA